MEIVLAGLLLGLMGSFHCVGMCGPIALSLPLRGNNNSQKIFGGILYNLGRTVTYGIMGAFFGIIGMGFHMAGFQQWVSVIMGSIMILAIILPMITDKMQLKSNDFLTAKLRHGIQNLFRQKSFSGLFFIGILNGLLPCGLVYMAIAGAIGTTNFYYSILFMVLFGLGTLPMLLLISIMGNLLSFTVRNRINKIIPYMVVVVGAIFILRGLSLGIPYLSPPAEKMDPAIHLKTEKPDAQAVKGSCCHSEE